MAKTYKTERGLKTALKKVLGEESKATENGTMSKGFLMFPVENKKTYRVIYISDGRPVSIPEEMLKILIEDFDSTGFSSQMFGTLVNYVDIPLEVSK
ncbi:hypothetical protein FOL75_12160 [Bacillus thuringiensis]|uniref:hypothetical protein n=1 Tax=Bacillus thuringiensis TaxID=1428 RepID=UPI002853E48B|nr:hypothetical protein [Bacillus thuringiensis]MDR5022698.1 hypothetical protein [Bacillus thuringiensis]